MVSDFSSSSSSLPVVVNGVALTPIELDGARYTTFAQIDQVHGRPQGTASRTFTSNRDRFTDGPDFRSTNFVQLKKANVLRPNSQGAILLTQRGYLKIVKSLQDDLAWDIYEVMLDRFFRIPQAPVLSLIDEIRLHPEKAATLIGDLSQQAVLAAPKVKGYDLFLEAKNGIEPEVFFKRMESLGYTVGRTRGFNWLRGQGIVQKAPSTLPYQKYLEHDPKRFMVHQVVKKMPNGKIMTFPQMLITPEGEAWLADLFQKTYQD